MYTPKKVAKINDRTASAVALVHARARAYPGRSCDSFNQLAKKLVRGCFQTTLGNINVIVTLTFDPPPSSPRLNVTGKSRTILALVPAFYESLMLHLALGVCVYAVSGHSSYCPKERSLLQFHFRPFATAAIYSVRSTVQTSVQSKRQGPDPPPS